MENSQISQLTVRGIHARRILRQLIDAFEQARVECAREQDSWLHPID